MPFSNEEIIRILIVEDKQEWVDIIKENLPGNFYIDEASTIENIKTLLQKNTYNLIIADLVLSTEEDNLFDIFRDISNLIFAIKQTKAHGRLWPPIIVITAYQIYPRMPEFINYYGGWIWGWHEKGNFDFNAFHRNVETALETKETFEKSLKPLDKWTFSELLDVLSHMTIQGWGAVAGIIGFLLTLAYYVGIATS